MLPFSKMMYVLRGLSFPHTINIEICQYLTVIIPCVPTEPHTESCSVVVHKKCPLGTDLSLQKWVDAQLANRTEIQKGAKGCWKVVRCSAPSHVQLECSMCAHLSTY